MVSTTPRRNVGVFGIPRVAAAAGLMFALGTLVAELRDAGVLDPLSQPVTLAAVIADLCRISGTPLPDDVAALVS